MTTILWSLIAAQIAMGAFDTLYHHELTERLAWRATQRRELKLHGVRNFFYVLLFLVFGWTKPHGLFAMFVLAVLAIELLVTLMDFVEEDLSRKLPPSERITHTLLALNYGAILVLLVPVLVDWAGQASAIGMAYYGFWSILLAIAIPPVIVSGFHDLMASRRFDRLEPPPAAGLVTALKTTQTVLITGATGFIGRRLVEALSASGANVIVLTRSPAKALALRPPFRVVTSLDQIASDSRVDAIVNLAGEPIGDGLWTGPKRNRIVQSRLAMTADVVALIARLETKPDVLVSGSAVGWYGLNDEEWLVESADGRECFCHTVCDVWENEAKKAREHGVRVVLLRIGLVLGTEGGMLSRLLMPFEYGLGGPIGSGKQWMSWIERDDLVRLIGHVIATPDLRGPVNATAPTAVTNAEFARELAHALHRPAIFRLPAWPLHVLGGGFADELLLGGQRVIPRKAVSNGFTFRHETLKSAFAAMLGNRLRGVRSSRLRPAH
jgi:uncharacterized protein (TIGR01777 family)